MEVVETWANIQNGILFQKHLFCLFSFNGCFIRKKLQILVRGKVVVLKLFIDFVEAVVLELAEDEAEKDRHVGVVVERHSGALFYEEKDQAVVFGVLPSDSNSV